MIYSLHEEPLKKQEVDWKQGVRANTLSVFHYTNSGLKFQKLHVPKGKVTFTSHTDPTQVASRAFGYCTPKQDGRYWGPRQQSNGKGHYGPTDQSDPNGQSWPPPSVYLTAKEIEALNITLFSCINSTNVHLCNYCTKIFVIVVNTCVCRRSVDNKAVILSYPILSKGASKYSGRTESKWTVPFDFLPKFLEFWAEWKAPFDVTALKGFRGLFSEFLFLSELWT